MKEQDKKMVLPKLDDLFTSQEQRDNPVVDEVTPSLSQAIRLKKLEQEGNLTEEKNRN